MYTVAWQNKADASHRGGMQTISAEVKKKLILHAINASQNGATKLNFFLRNTDVLVLCLIIYTEFLRETIFVTGIQTDGGNFNLRPIYLALED